MAEDLILNSKNKEENYKTLTPQIKALCDGENNLTANLANIAAALKEAFGFFWVGFYTVASPNELVLGPFQGPVACTRIGLGKGVCGSAWAQKQILVVPNVEEFPGHIACSSLSKSEIVIPILKNDEVVAILDIDSKELDDFDETDESELKQLCEWIASLF